MSRREFMALVGGAAACCVCAALAQQPREPVIGFLNGDSTRAHEIGGEILSEAGTPSWSREIHTRQPVLEDRSRAFSEMIVSHPAWPEPMTKNAQGGVFYNRPLDRYIYTSWTRFSWEFYEAPKPWGPWRHFTARTSGSTHGPRANTEAMRQVLRPST